MVGFWVLGKRALEFRFAIGSTYAPAGVLEFRARLDVFALLRAGALVEGAITNWRFDSGPLLRLTFHAPNLTVEHGSQRQQVAVSWYSPYSPIIRPHLHCRTCHEPAIRALRSRRDLHMRTTRLCLPSHQPADAAANPDCAAAEIARRGSRPIDSYRSQTRAEGGLRLGRASL